MSLATCWARRWPTSGWARSATEGTANVQVFNPDLVANGWQSAHTVVQIVTDDMPFLVDSVRMAMTAMGLGIHLVIHPMLRVVRDDGTYVRVEEGTANEAWIYVEVDRCDATRLELLRQHLVAALDDVRVAVTDWRPMRDRCDQLAHELEHSVLPLGTGEATRAAQFLRWLSDDHLVFLGYREYDFVHEAEDDDVVVAVPGTGLGLLRDGRRTEEPHRLSSVTPEARRMVFAPAVLMLTTANSRSTVCRADYLAYIGVKRFDREGRVIGERRFLGLYNSDVYRDSVLDIPLLRDKAAEVLDRAGFAAESHSGRALRQILETYPRNELFQIDADELLRDRDRHPRAPGPAPGPPVRAAGRLRPLRLLPRVPPARPLLDRSGRADRQPRSRRRTAARAPSTRSSSGWARWPGSTCASRSAQRSATR